MRRPNGVTLILVATAIASVAGFAVITVVPRQIGLADYKVFGLFWSAMYLVISALSGIQQEITRATLRREPVPNAPANPARIFGLIAAGAVFAVIVASAPLWVGVTFPEQGWVLVWPLAFACSSYVLVAVLAGTLYGITLWAPLALMISVDAVLRLTAVITLSAFTDDPVVLAWAAAGPFLLTIAILWPAFRRSVVGRTTIDVGYRPLVWNSSRTVVASASSGILVSGLPVVLGIAATDEPAATVAALFVAITLTRAPVIVVVMSLQSYLVVRFRDNSDSFWRTLATLVGIVLAAGAVVAVAAWLVAPAIFDALYEGEIVLPGWFYAVLVVSSALIGVLCVTAPAVLALSEHFVYSLGWLVAAVSTIVCFALPLDLLSRTVLALLVGPVLGIAVHAAHLARRRASASR